MREIKVRNPREFAGDIQAALRLTDDERLTKYGMALRALRVVWKSRRELQDQLAKSCARVAELEEDYAHLQNAFRATSDQAEALATDAYADSRRLAELEAFVADIACHGLRGDMNPTMIAGSAWERELHLLQYLRSLNDHLKAAAREYVPDAEVPNDRGRPRPTPRVEVVAERDLLRAQDGHR